ncbi:hypothetical protein MBLNU459_g6170t1 [Dothideomycetes sp. NU459]
MCCGRSSSQSLHSDSEDEEKCMRPEYTIRLPSDYQFIPAPAPPYGAFQSQHTPFNTPSRDSANGARVHQINHASAQAAPTLTTNHYSGNVGAHVGLQFQHPTSSNHGRNAPWFMSPSPYATVHAGSEQPGQISEPQGHCYWSRRGSTLSESSDAPLIASRNSSVSY